MVGKIIITIIILFLGIVRFVSHRRRTWSWRMRRLGRMWDKEDGSTVVAMPTDGSRALETLATMSESCGRWKSIEFSPRFIRRLCHEMEGAGKEGAVVPYDVFIDGLGAITYALSLYRSHSDAKAVYDAVIDDAGTVYEKWIKDVDDFLDYYDV